MVGGVQGACPLTSSPSSIGLVSSTATSSSPSCISLPLRLLPSRDTPLLTSICTVVNFGTLEVTKNVGPVGVLKKGFMVLRECVNSICWGVGSDKKCRTCLVC